ncbi:hypothetical protein [Novosphingobium sp. PhB165]|uniref:hypothetical protein n=1 Tax=Novosphingobium sp. PhB165 TaxID=2485105 RepID=UPI001051AAD4|nr:hypothetical protein [Novosphingobium sp. PhB165]
MIEFEALGGVGDGDPNTGRGTDNARAFARAETMAQQGYGIKFKPRASYKTTEQINIHSMYWVGDETSSPIIFGWFSEKGKKIIGRSNKKDPLSVCIMGINFHRCGPFAEHGIVIDNIERLYFDGAVTSEPGAQGGAIGISPFFPERRHSRNCFIKARINNSGDFGVQLGSVSGAIIDVTATDCYREVIGIEPVVSGTMEINKANIVGNDISVIDPDLPNGTPILYCYGSNSRGPLTPGKHYFVIKNDNHTISLADSRESSAKGHKLDLKLLEGEHYFAKSAVVEDIAIRFAKIIDNHAKKPTLYANTMGYIVITGNSGGYMNNIKLDNVYIEGNQIYKSGKSVGIYVQGAEDLILSNINVHGCDDAVVVSDGWLNGMFDERGRPIRIENGYSKLSSKNILVTDPNLTDFRSHGVLFRGNGGTLRGGKFSSRVKDAKLVVRE